MKTDVEIAQETTLRPVTEIAAGASIDQRYLELYSNYKAKVDYSYLRDNAGKADRKPALYHLASLR